MREMTSPSQKKKSPQEKSKDLDKLMKLLKKLLEFLLKQFGMSLGGGGEQLNDNFLNKSGNKDLFKDKAKQMLNSKLGGFTANIGLRFKSVRDAIDNHLKNNPELEKATKEVFNEDPKLKERFSKNKNFMKTFSRLLEPTEKLEKEADTTAGAKSADQAEEQEPSYAQTLAEVEQFAKDNPTQGLNQMLNTLEAPEGHPLSSPPDSHFKKEEEEKEEEERDGPFPV